MSKKVVITDCDHDSMEPEYEAAAANGVDLSESPSPSPEAIVAAAKDADAIVVQYVQITAELMDQLPNLKAIGRYGVGVDTIDVPAATARGIAVCSVPDYGTESVSDHAIGLALAVARGIPRLDRGVRAGSADFVPVKPLYGFGGRTFGVVGLGLIGTATARKARGLGYEVIAYDTAIEPGAERDGVKAVSFEELLERSDVISLHVPLTAETHHMIGAEELTKLQPHAILVNTSRGGVVDTSALVHALEQGALYGAGLDVYEQEPLPAEHALTRFDNVVLTPHTAWYTEESYFELKRRVVENVARVVNGQHPRNILNPEVLPVG